MVQQGVWGIAHLLGKSVSVSMAMKWMFATWKEYHMLVVLPEAAAGGWNRWR